MRFATFSFVSSLAALACSSSSSGSGPGDAGPSADAAAHAACDAYLACGGDGGGPADAGSDGAIPEAGADATALGTLSGKIVDTSTKAPVVGASVGSGQSATSGPGGAFSMTFATNVPFRFTVDAAGYYGLVEQQTSSAATSLDFGAVEVFSESTASLLTASLPGYNAAGGIVLVRIVPQGACASEAGATIAVSGSGAAKIIYMRNGFPDGAATSAEQGGAMHAIVYNAPAGIDSTVTVAHPTCAAAPFPVTATVGGQSLTYVSAVTTPLAGKSISAVRVFLK